MNNNRLIAQRLMRMRPSFPWPVTSKLVIAFGQLLLILVTLHSESHAQLGSCTRGTLRVDDAVGSLHARKHPMTAQDKDELEIATFKERASGVTVLQVDVNTNGDVIAAVPLDGPRPLIQLFTDQARRITFYPFQENGQPVCVRFALRYLAGLGRVDAADARVEGKFIPLFNECSSLSAAKAGQQALSECRLAADAADKLTTMGNNQNRVAAYNQYASGLLLEKRSQEAFAYAGKAVAVCDLGFVDISDKAAAYGLRGQASGLMGDTLAARRDLVKAEQLARATFEVPRSPKQRKFDSGVLRSVLNFHAQMLADLGETTEADNLRDEAQKL